MLRITFLLLSFLLLAACANQSTLPTFANNQQYIEEAQQLFVQYFQHQQQPAQLTWPDLSADQLQKTLAYYQELLTQTTALPDHELDFNTYLNKQRLATQLEFNITQLEYYPYTLFNPDINLWPSRAIHLLVLEHKINSIADAQSYLQLLSSLPLLIKQWQQHYQAAHLAYPQELTQALLQELNAFELNTTNTSIIWRDFNRKVAKLDIYTNTRALLLKKAQTIIQRQVAPTYQQLIKQLESNSTTATAFLSQQEGQHYYQQLLNIYSDGQLGALQVHELAQAEVQQLQQAIGQLAAAFQQKSTTATAAPEAILEGNQRVTSYLTRSPQTPLILKPVKIEQASGYLLPYYSASDQGGHNPATYYYTELPQYSLMEHATHHSLAMRHAQTALLQEQTQHPDFIRFSQLANHSNAWELYSQQLGNLTIQQQLGGLLNKLQQASQVVIDTGTHALGWSTQQSLSYLAENTPFNSSQQQQLLTQALAQPGKSVQALLQLQKLQQLIQQAQKHQGKHFNLAKFHSDYLIQGPLSLTHYELWLAYWLQQ